MSTSKKPPGPGTEAPTVRSRQARQTGKVFETDVAKRTKDLQWENAALKAEIKELRRVLSNSRRAEEALQETGARVKSALEGAQAGMWIWDLRETWETSPEINTLFRRSPDDPPMRYEEFMALLHPDDVERITEAWNKTVQSGDPYEQDYRIMWPDGSVRWLTSRARVVTFPSGARKLLGVTFDITERKRTEETLKESQALLSAIAENLPDPLFVKDCQSRILFANRAVFQLVGKPMEEVIGKDDRELYTDLATGQALMENDRLVMESGTTQVMEEVARTPKGTFTYLSTKTPYRNGNGDIIGILGIARDITERKRMDEALRESENRLRFALETSHTGAWDLDLVDHTAARSLEHDRIFGYPYLLPQWTYEMFLEHVVPDDRPMVDAKFRAAMERHSDWSFECRIRRVDGEVRWIWAAGRHREAEMGVGSRMTGIIQDITERRQAEEELREALETLQRNEEQFRALIHNVGSAVALVDETGKFSVVNPMFLQMFGLGSQSDILNVNSQDWSRWEVYGEDGELLHVDDHPVRKAAMTGKPARDRLIGVRSPGAHDLTWMSISAEPLLREDGTVRMVICTYHDVTERIRMENALQKSEEKYRNLLRYAPAAIYEIDFEGTRFFSVNEAMCDILGYSREELLTLKPVDLLDKAGRSAFGERIKKKLEGETIDETMEYRVRRKDGVWIDVVINVGTYAYSDEKPERLVVVGYDVTERKRMELAVTNDVAALSRLHRLSTAVLDAGGVDHLLQEIMEAAVEIVAAQRGILQLLEGDSLRIVAHHGHERPFLDFFEEAENPASVCGETLRQGERTIVEDVESSALFVGTPSLPVWRAAGVRAVQSTPIFSRTGELTGILTTQWERPYVPDEHDLWRIDLLARQAADLIEQVRTHEEVRRSRDELERRVEERTAELTQAYSQLETEMAERERAEAQLRQSQKMEALGTLTGGIAHDFNNLLAAIIGFAEMAHEDLPEDTSEKRYMERVLQAGLRGRELIKQLLAFSRKGEQEKKPLLLSRVIAESMQLLRASLPTTIDIRADVAHEAGPILADPVQVEQVIMNLCTNAAHAMRERGGTLTLHLSTQHTAATNRPDAMKPGAYLTLAVSDTGCGMTPEVQARIFDPFYSTKEQGEGSGLGLSVVHGIMQQSDGYITVESAPGRGSTFTVSFPLVGEEAPVPQVAEDLPPAGYERVLFVDDEPALVEMGRELLERLGYRVTATTRCTEALAVFMTDPEAYDVIIIDQTMPEMTGMELAGRILPMRPDIPIILCTGFSHLVDEDAARQAGIRAFVMKPLTKGELARTVRAVLEG